MLFLLTTFIIYRIISQKLGFPMPKLPQFLRRYLLRAFRVAAPRLAYVSPGLAGYLRWLIKPDASK